MQGDYAAAMDQLKKAWEDPLYERPWLALANGGFCADRNGDRKRAEDLLREALRRNPKYGPALVGMARYSIEANNALSARGYLERLKEVARPTAESLWIGIRAEHALGERDAVASQALLLRASFPDSEEAREWQVFAKREGYTP